MNNKTWSVANFLLGITVGTVAGLLLAPKTGEETREVIGDWLKTQREKGSKAVAEFRNRIPAQKEKLVKAWEKGKNTITKKLKKEETAKA